MEYEVRLTVLSNLTVLKIYLACPRDFSKQCSRDRELRVMVLMFYHFFATLLENYNSSSCFEGLYGNLIHVPLDCFFVLDGFFLFVSR